MGSLLTIHSLTAIFNPLKEECLTDYWNTKYSADIVQNLLKMHLLSRFSGRQSRSKAHCLKPEVDNCPDYPSEGRGFGREDATLRKKSIRNGFLFSECYRKHKLSSKFLSF